MLRMYSTIKHWYKERVDSLSTHMTDYGHKSHQSTILTRSYCTIVQTSTEHMKHDYLN